MIIKIKKDIILVCGPEISVHFHNPKTDEQEYDRNFETLKDAFQRVWQVRQYLPAAFPKLV